eukprot:g15279.t1
MSYRARLSSARDERSKGTRTVRRSTSHSRGQSSTRRSDRPPILRPLLAGMISAAALLYACGWDSTRARVSRSTGVARASYGRSRGYRNTDIHSSSSSSKGVKTGLHRADKPAAGSSWEREGGSDPSQSELNAKLTRNGEVLGGDRQHHWALGDNQAAAESAGVPGAGAIAGTDGAPPLSFSEEAVRVVVSAVESYAAWARRTLEADENAVQQGRPLQGKYIVLDSGNELANRLRGVLSGFFLGVLTDRVFVADITYQKDVTEGLLSALFEGPGYEWDLSKLAPELRRALAPSKNKGSSRGGKVRGGAGGGSGSATLVFDMSKNHFHRWTCDDVLEGVVAQVVTLSTVVYPLPLLARNPTYASHPIFLAAATAAHGGGGAGPGGAGQRGIEALETLLTRVVLRPKRELRERAMELAGRVREKADEWVRERGRDDPVTGGVPRPVRVVGIHARTYFVKAVSTDTLEGNLRHFEDCALGGGRGHTSGDCDTFFFVATDEAQTQAVARKVWGGGCHFEPFGLPGSKLEGIKAALVDLLVMGSFDDYVMTPHSSFSELGAMLSHTWLPDPQAALRAPPNRPIVPLFPQMSDFERQKVLSLLDRRAAEIVPVAAGGASGVGTGGEGAVCMRVHAAGMSVVVAKGRELLSMFEAIEGAPCMRGKREGIAAPTLSSSMGKGNVDDPERDPALFPESRVRPWVVDEEADCKMQEKLDNLEKTMTFMSPVKDGLGVSTLDRTLLCDNRGELFVKELAALEAAEKAKAARVASGPCGLEPIGEIFEDLYRQTHGLPRRNSARREGSWTYLNGEQQASGVEEATAAADEGGAALELQDGGDEELAADPEVARLLSELQTELDTDGSDGFDSDADEGEAEGREGEGGEGGEGGKKIENGNESDDGSRGRSEAAWEKSEPERRDSATLTLPPRAGEQRQPPVESSSAAGPAESQPRTEPSKHEGWAGQKIDISRMKIDAPHHCSRYLRGRPRPHSAPSACLSAGGFSRLSSRASSGSRISRTVSQKLLQAMKEERTAAAAVSEAHGRGGAGAEVEAALRQRSIDVVKQTAEALQASLSVKRTSYLNARQPSPARRSPPSPPAARQRPKTALADRRRHPPRKRGPTGNDNNLLLSHLEREFLFGAGAAKAVAVRTASAAHQGQVGPAPSMRKTTLGRLLRHSAGSSSSPSLPTTSVGDPQHHASPLSESSSASSLYRRPLSADSNGGCRADDHTNNRSRRRKLGRSLCCNNRPSSSRSGNAAVLARARTRPSSAAPGSGRRRTEPPPFSAAAGNLPSHLDGYHRHPDRSLLKSSAFRTSTISVGGTAAVRSPANHDAAEAMHACEAEKGSSEGTAAAATGRTGRKPPLNVHQALEATIKAAIGVVSPREQFVNARRTIAEMKKINTKDSTGDILLSTQGMTKARIAEECWSSEAGREYR